MPIDTTVLMQTLDKMNYKEGLTLGTHIALQLVLCGISGSIIHDHEHDLH